MLFSRTFDLFAETFDLYESKLRILVRLIRWKTFFDEFVPDHRNKRVLMMRLSRTALD